MKSIVLALTVALLSAVPAAAQEHEGHQPKRGDHDAHAGQQMHGQMAGHCMAVMGGIAPAMMSLHHADELALTADQSQQLESLMTRTHEAARPHMRMAMEAGARAGELLDAERPDFAAYEQQLGEAAAHMVQAHTALARATVEARGLLTPEQRTRISEMDHDMSGMPCPMMHGDAGSAAGAAHDNH